VVTTGTRGVGHAVDPATDDPLGDLTRGAAGVPRAAVWLRRLLVLVAALTLLAGLGAAIAYAMAPAEAHQLLEGWVRRLSS
jgi:hypothetical protein